MKTKEIIEIVNLSKKLKNENYDAFKSLKQYVKSILLNNYKNRRCF